MGNKNCRHRPQDLLLLLLLLALSQKHRLDYLAFLGRQMTEVGHRRQRRSPTGRRHGGPTQAIVGRPTSVQTVRDASAAVTATVGAPCRRGHRARSDVAAVDGRRTVGERHSDDGGHNESMRQAAVVAGHVGVELLQQASDALPFPLLAQSPGCCCCSCYCVVNNTHRRRRRVQGPAAQYMERRTSQNVAGRSLSLVRLVH